MRSLWFFLPDEAMPFVIVAVGLALIVGLIRPRAAFGVILTLILVLLAAPFVDLLLDALPWWLVLLLAFWVGLYLFRSLFALLIGPRATDEMVGGLAADAVRAVFRAGLWLAALPFRIAAWMLRRV